MGLSVRPASAHLEHLEWIVRAVSGAADSHRYVGKRSDRPGRERSTIVGIVAGDVFDLRRVFGFVVAEGQSL